MQDQLAGSRMGRVYFFESIAPVVKQSSKYPKLSRKPEYVVAGLHSLESLASKFVTVSLPFLSVHFAAPFSQSVHHKLSHSRGSLHDAPAFWAVPGQKSGEWLPKTVSNCASLHGLANRRPEPHHHKSLRAAVDFRVDCNCRYPKITHSLLQMQRLPIGARPEWNLVEPKVGFCDRRGSDECTI